MEPTQQILLFRAEGNTVPLKKIYIKCAILIRLWDVALTENNGAMDLFVLEVKM
jgi:hypothetical protein